MREIKQQMTCKSTNLIYMIECKGCKKQYVWVIDQVWGQDGWILAKFFFCVFMDRDGVEVHKLAKKKNEANIQPSWPNKLGQ